jgi:hydroxymethylglutaryl-CoA lyase
MNNSITIVECPRDAMQGWHRMIGTDEKVAYINQLLKVGFHTLDCVSFVSPKAIPQMADSAEVLAKIDWEHSKTRLLAIVANLKGAQAAVAFPQVAYLGFPFSISETFQQLNTNSSVSESWNRLKEMNALCNLHGKQLVVYISMGFGNPYGDLYDEEVIAEWLTKMEREGIRIVSLADTVGLASPEMVNRITQATISAFPGLEIGVHLHSLAEGFSEKLDAALLAGCHRFDGAINGIGGCPMAQNTLVGNMDTLRMIDFFEKKGLTTGINRQELDKAVQMARQIFE